MRVLLYSTAIYPKVDGVANRVKHHIRALVALGHQVLVLCPYDSAPSLYEGAQVLRLPAFVPLDYDESQLSYPFPLMTLNRVFREFRPDIIHFIGPEFVLIPFLLLSRYYKVPILVSYHFYVRAFLNSMPFPMRMLFTWMTWMEMACNFADLVICPSKPMMNILRDIGMRCEDIWPPAVDIQQFSPSYYDHDLRSKFTFGNPDKPLVIYIGRVAPEKNMDALNRILERFPDAYLAIIGKGPDAPKWARLHGKENRIFCTNAHYHGETLSKAFAVADVFVLPSEFETLGNVVLESMASGVPVVGCNAGGIPHMLSNEKTGLLFEPGDLDGMCEAVGRIIYDRELRERFKQAGLEYTSNKSWRHASEYVVALYEKCIRRHGKLVPGVNAPPEPVYDVGPIFVDPMIGVAPRPGSEGARIDALASAGTASTVVDTRSGGPFGMRSMLPWLLSVMFGVLVFVFVRFNQASNNP